MLKAFGRLFLILFFTIFAAVLIVLSLRAAGSGQLYAPADHPALAKDKWWFLQAPKPNESASLDASTFIFAPLFLSKADVWIVSEVSFIKSDDGRIQPLNSLSLDELRSHGIESLEFYLNKYPQNGFVLSVQDATGRGYEKLVQMMAERGFDGRTFVTSPYQIAVTEIRRLKPLWLFGASTQEISKLRFFTSLFIEPLAHLNSDFFIFDKIPNERLIFELRKRHKKLILRPSALYATDESQLKAALDRVDGLLLKDPVILQQLVAPTP